MKLPASVAYKFSIICGGLSLVVGSTIFFVWLATGQLWLEKAGLVALLGGLIFFVAGLVALLVWLVKAAKSAAPRRQILSPAILSAALLLANFPVASAIIWGVMTIKSTYYLTIKNKSPVPADEVHFFGQGYDLNIGTIPPTERLELKLHPVVSGESTLLIKGRCGDNTFTNIVEGYFETGYGGKALVTVEVDGRVKIENPH